MEAAPVIRPGCSSACATLYWPCSSSPLIWRWCSCSPGPWSTSVSDWWRSSICSCSSPSWPLLSSLPGRKVPLTGSANVTTRTHAGWLVRLKQSPCRYFALDGGSGAHLCAALAGRHPYVQQVASPRHADLLVIVEPVSQKLAPALVELARSL